MIKNNFIKNTAITATVVSSLLASALAMGVSTAYASKPDPHGVTPTITNDIAVHVVATKANNVKTTLKGRKLVAYRLAKFKDVATANANGVDVVKGYDLKADDNLRGVLMKAVKNAVVSEGKVTDAFKTLVELKGDDIHFIGAANNLSPEKFVEKYFYGEGTDAYGNTRADGKASKDVVAGGKITPIATHNEIRLFADYLVKEGKAQLGTGTPLTVNEAGDTAVLDVKDGEEGVYLIADETNASELKDATVSRAMIVGSAFKGYAPTDPKHLKLINQLGEKNPMEMGVINLKADSVVIKKTVVKAPNLVKLGDERDFEITTNVPNYANESQSFANPPEFYVTDNPSDGLTVEKDTVEVKAGDNNTVLKKDVDYTVEDNTDTADDKNDFIVRFKNPNAQSGNKIVITYKTKITSLDDKIDNEAGVTFSNDPYSTSHTTTNTVKDNSRLYHADLNLQKIAMNQSTNYLNGAEFQVTHNGQTVKFTKKGNVYSISDKGTTKTLALDSVNNVFTTISGLANSAEAQTYTFKEVKAPAGYILGDTPVTFDVVVTPTIKDDKVESVSYTVNAGNYANFLDEGTLKGNGQAQVVKADLTDGKNTAVVGGEIKIENTTSSQDFAKTGGQLTLYIAVAAGFVVAGAIAAGFARRNRNKA